MRATLILAVPLAVSALAAPAFAQELRIGFVNTTTGSLAVAGAHMENGWKLGLEAEENLDYGFFVRDPEGVPVQIVGT